MVTPSIKMRSKFCDDQGTFAGRRGAPGGCEAARRHLEAMTNNYVLKFDFSNALTVV